MPDEIPIADAIAAVQAASEVLDGWILSLGLRAALGYLSDYERVVAERDAARAELVEAQEQHKRDVASAHRMGELAERVRLRAEIERLTDELAIAENDKDAPPTENAMEARRIFWEAYEAHQVEGQNAAVARVDAALTAAREAERRKWEAATQPGVDPSGLLAYVEGREMAAREDEREKYRALVEAARAAAIQIEYLHEKFSATGSGASVLARIEVALAALEPPLEPTGCADDCAHPSHGHRR